MLDIAWPELMIIGIVAVVAIGPKDLPKVMHTMGRWTGEARMMAQDIQRSIEQLNFEAEAAERVSKNSAEGHQTAVHHSRIHHTSRPVSEEGSNDHLGST